VLNNIKVEESHEKPKGAVLISTFLLLNLNKYQCRIRNDFYFWIL
jgi:hypothetical protein